MARTREEVLAKAQELADAGNVDAAKELLTLWKQQQPKAPAPPKPSGLEAAGRGLRQGASFNLAEEGQAAAGAAMDWFKQGTPFRENYESLRDAYRGEEAAAREAHPGLYLGGEILGGFTTGGAGAGRVAASQAVRNAPLLSRIGAMTGIGAAEGGLYGYGASSADDWAELGSDVALGAGFGVGGSLLGPTLSGAGRTARTLVGKGGAQRAKGRIGELLRATGLSPEQVAGEINKLGPGSTLGDLDRWMTAELREALSQSTPEAREALEFLAQRTEAGRGRVSGALQEGIDAPVSSSQVKAMNASDQIDAARPMYQEAMETVVDVDKYPGIGRLMEFAPIKKAVKKASESLRARDEPYGGFEILHTAKRKLDDQIAAAKRQGLDDEARDLVRLKHKLLTEMDNMAADQGHNYKEARQFYADAAASERALEIGQDLFRGRKDVSEVGALIEDMSIRERQSFLAGAADAAGEQIAYSTIKDPSKIFSPKNMALLRQVIPDDQDFQRVLSTMEGETRKMISAQVASGKVAINDSTLHGLGALVYGAAGNMNALAAVALNKLGQALSGMGGTQRAETIKLLTQTGLGPAQLEEIMKFANRGVLDASLKGVTISSAAAYGGSLAEEE